MIKKIKAQPKREVFLVLDNRIKNYDTSIADYLKNEGFTKKYSGYYAFCPWVFIDVINMTYCFGKPGVSFGPVICEHAITVEEFEKIWGIYKKYKGKRLREMGE